MTTLNGLCMMAVAAAALSACALAQPSHRDASVPITVEPSVDLQRYAGRWYEIARYPNWFERGCQDVTAEYALQADGRVRVVNTCVRPDAQPPVFVADGRARVVEGSNNAKLRVSFAPEWIPFAWGDYWVLEVDDAYQTALVGAPNGGYLWILARTPSIAPETRAHLEEAARRNGFDPSKLENTVHTRS
ncbi:MAG: lipocalin family protein [Hyphomonadaceae bacterium]|nr:lipocalin family protein [Hyphomonadaceae bacterium]